jgi:hypothetical protein
MKNRKMPRQETKTPKKEEINIEAYEGLIHHLKTQIPLPDELRCAKPFIECIGFEAWSKEREATIRKWERELEEYKKESARD